MRAEPSIIGRGTWLDKVASEVLAREERLGRKLGLLRVESGLGASGIPHIGSVGDAIRSYGVKLGLETAGYKSELIAYSDDFDGLRKVPAGFPAWLKDYIAQPVSRIPDPFGCHGSYAEHVGSLLREAMDKLGIEYRFQSGAEAYEKGLLNERIKVILSRADEIGRKIKEMVGQSKYEKSLPYTPVCKQCNRIYTTQAHSYDAKRATVGYRCEGTKLGSSFLKGCGFEGEASVLEGNGKLMWKVEFAARWAALDIRFEAYGKEIGDSVKINDWVAEYILAFPPPHHARYELFQDKSGKKMSKSVGNLVTPQEWLNYASPESLRLLMYKRIIGARSVSLDDLPVYVEDFDDLEENYFSKTRDPNQMKDARLKGLYEYTMLLRPPNAKPVHVPYKLMAQLASVAPEGSVHDFVLKRLVAYGMVKESSPELMQKISWASAWGMREGKRTPEHVEVSPTVSRAIKQFAERIVAAKNADEVQNAAFEAVKGHGLKPGDFFPAVYSILVGSDRGPRLGPYVMDAGPKSVGKALLDAVKR
ncbi:MAG: lysine--tRNA ligase [Nitrososphaerales archaeon]|nr:lysine--tRNA ligase [Nitrososphaerales archaeon]